MTNTAQRWRLKAALIVGLASSGQYAFPVAAQSPSPSAAAGIVSVEVGSVTGKPGEQITVEVRLHTAGFAVAGVQNDISFMPIVVSLVGCAVNPDIGKDLTQFGLSFAGLRAIVLGNNVDPIPDGALLYTCTFTVPPGAPQGDWPLTISRVFASSPFGEMLPARGSNGLIVIPGAPPTLAPTATPTPIVPAATPTPAQPSVIVDPVEGQAGDDVLLQVRLVTTGESVAGTQNDIAFDSINTSIAARPNGKPDCRANADIDKGATSFAFLPSGCSGSACTAVRAVVFATDNVAPIADGEVLYTCTVHIAATAPLGVYPLSISGIVLSTPDGGRVSAATTSLSVVLVGIAYDPHDPTVHVPIPGEPGVSPVAPSTALPTATASPPAATASNGGTTAAFSEGGGCSVADPPGNHAAALLLLPAVLGATGLRVFSASRARSARRRGRRRSRGGGCMSGAVTTLAKPVRTPASMPVADRTAGCTKMM